MEIENYAIDSTRRLVKQMAHKLTITPVFRGIVDYNGFESIGKQSYQWTTERIPKYTTFPNIDELVTENVYTLETRSQVNDLVLNYYEGTTKTLIAYVNRLNGFTNVCPEDRYHSLSTVSMTSI